jgi:hypothetical protein
MSAPWTLFNGGQTLCRCCGKKISTKPAAHCDEPRHLKTYNSNAAQTSARRRYAQYAALVHYSGHNPPQCVLCGYDNVLALQLDHIDGDGAAFRKVHPHKIGKSLALWLRKMGWPTGYRVLCANCQILERERLGCNGGKKTRRTVVESHEDPTGQEAPEGSQTMPYLHGPWTREHVPEAAQINVLTEAACRTEGCPESIPSGFDSQRLRHFKEGAMKKLAVLALIALATPAFSQDVPKPPCDHLIQPCAVFEGWLVTERIWASNAEPRNIVGARLQAEVRLKRWRWAVQGDATGVPGEYDQGNIETVRVATGYVAGAYDLWQLPGDVNFGPAFGAGGDVVIEKNAEGVTAGLPKRLTAGLGARASGKGWWTYVIVGQNQALRGVAMTTAWQVKLNDRTASIGNVTVGSTEWVAKTGIAVRWK